MGEDLQRGSALRGQPYLWTSHGQIGLLPLEHPHFTKKHISLQGTYFTYISGRGGSNHIGCGCGCIPVYVKVINICASHSPLPLLPSSHLSSSSPLLSSFPSFSSSSPPLFLRLLSYSTERVCATCLER